MDQTRLEAALENKITMEVEQILLSIQDSIPSEINRITLITERAVIRVPSIESTK